MQHAVRETIIPIATLKTSLEEKETVVPTSDTDNKGLVYNIQGYSIHDGPGIRTTVFMKGCPLNCKWCANPESINDFPEILYNKEKCVKCYRCVEICPHGAVTFPGKGEFISIDREICKDCLEHTCVKECYQGALEIAGSYMTTEELLKEVGKDLIFYRNSGGGVTLSGGDPTAQPEFALQIFKGCKKKGIHTALDTCGYVPWEILKDILEYTDLLLYDIKHMDPDIHTDMTGVSNELILQNLEAVFSAAKVPTNIRVPVIPGYNNSKENIKATARFVKELGANKVNILPYHRLGMGKYARLGRKYPLEENIQPPGNTEMEEIKNIIETYGLGCSIGG